MSIALMTLAWQSEIASGAKMVLLSLCDNSNDQGECYPSIATICKRCSMSERTVQGHINALEKQGCLTRKERQGHSTLYKIDPRRIIGSATDESHYVYRIEDAITGEFYIGLRTCLGDPKTDGYMGSGSWFNERVSDGGTLKKTIIELLSSRDDAAKKERELVAAVFQNPLCMNKRTPAESAPRRICPPQNLRPTPADSAPTPAESAPTVPAESAPITVIEPSMNRQVTVKARGASVQAVIFKVDDVDEAVWKDFVSLRKAKKSPLTKTAVDGIRNEAAKAGWTLEAAITECCTRGWVGFKADWVADKQPKGKDAAPAETTYQRSMRERYEEATGRRNTGPAAHNVIDITPVKTFLEISQ